MSITQLSDLDELILLCRNDTARKYVAEGVASYKAGAFRACIIVTWTAIVYDYLEKIEELSLTGDNEAKRRLEDFRKHRKSGDFLGTQKFEQELLDAAKQFEFISDVEYVDLQRLKEDRNRCAHPSITVDDEVYEPSAELARYHMRTAVTAFLCHPPAQGKAALAWLLGQLDSPYFPSGTDAVKEILAGGPLARPRDSLVRNFTIVLTKRLLGSADRYIKEFTTLNVVRQMHRSVVEDTFREKLSNIMAGVPEEGLLWALDFLSRIPDTWQFIDPANQHKIKAYVASLPSDEFAPGIACAYAIEELKDIALARLMRADLNDLSDIDSSHVDRMPREYVRRVLELYEQSESFDVANRIAKEFLAPLITRLDREDVDTIARIFADNSQVAGSWQALSLMKQIRETGPIPKTEFDSIARRHGANPLMKLSVDPDEQ